MIGCNQINCAILKTRYNCLPVPLFPKRWIHLCKRSLRNNRILRQGKMMWGCLCVDICTCSLALSDKLYPLFRTDMLDHNRCSRLKCQPDIPLNHGDLRIPLRSSNSIKGCCLTGIHTIILNILWILFMEADRLMVKGCLLHRLCDHLFRQDRNTIIREAYCSCLT